MRKGIYKNILKPRIKSFISSMSSGEQVEWNDEHGIPMKTDSDDYDYVLQPNIYKTKLVNANYTITIEDIKTNVTLVVNTTSAEIVLTLPAKSVIPDNGYIWAFNIVHRVGTNNVKVQCDGTEKFIFGNSYFNLGSHLFMFTIGCSNLDGTTSWGILRNITIRGSFHRDAAWAASNFSSVTIVPFDSEEYNNNDEILVYTAGASSRITIKTAGSYKISYNMSIDSTGGITWNATSHIYKNGVLLDSSEVRTGNYGDEDQSMSCIPFNVSLDVDDYIDLRIVQNNLTGSLVHAIVNMEIRL